MTGFAVAQPVELCPHHVHTGIFIPLEKPGWDKTADGAERIGEENNVHLLVSGSLGGQAVILWRPFGSNVWNFLAGCFR